MSELQKINDFQRLSEEEFFKKYNQTKSLALRDWKEESVKKIAMTKEKTTKLLRKISPCPHCNSKCVGVKYKYDKKVVKGKPLMKVWAYCSECGYEGREVVGTYDDTEEARDAAYEIWNRR